MNTRHDNWLVRTKSRGSELRNVAVFLVCVGSFLTVGAATPATHPQTTRLPKVGILPTAPAELFTVEPGAKPFSDRDATIESLDPEIRGLNGVRIRSSDRQVELDSHAPVQLLIGIFRGEGREYAPPPADKTPAIKNAAVITGMPPLDVYLVNFDKGKRTVPLGGACVILGVIPAGVATETHDANGGVR